MREIFITGVSSGIGLSLARKALAQGSTVYGVSRRRPAGLAGAFHFQSLDLTDYSRLENSLSLLFAKAKKLDIAVLNAAILGPVGDLSTTPLDEIKRVMEVNVWSNKMLLDILFRLLPGVKQVVTISSGAAVNAARGWNGYSISKAALNMLTALYAAERPQTHFCALAPGIIDTPMQDQIAGLPDDPALSAFQFLRDAKGTELMPGPEEAASRLWEGMAQAVEYPSGSFLDIDELAPG